MWLGDGETQVIHRPPQHSGREAERGRAGWTMVTQAQGRQSQSLGPLCPLGMGLSWGSGWRGGGGNSCLVSGHRAKGQVLACSPVASAPSATTTVRAVGCRTGPGWGGKAAWEGPEKPLRLLRGRAPDFPAGLTGVLRIPWGRGSLHLRTCGLGSDRPPVRPAQDTSSWEQWIGGLC